MSDVSRRLGKEENNLYSAQNKYSISKCFVASLCSRALCLLMLLLGDLKIFYFQVVLVGCVGFLLFLFCFSTLCFSLGSEFLLLFSLSDLFMF